MVEGEVGGLPGYLLESIYLRLFFIPRFDSIVSTYFLHVYIFLSLVLYSEPKLVLIIILYYCVVWQCDSCVCVLCRNSLTGNAERTSFERCNAPKSADGK